MAKRSTATEVVLVGGSEVVPFAVVLKVQQEVNSEVGLEVDKAGVLEFDQKVKPDASSVGSEVDLALGLKCVSSIHLAVQAEVE